MPVTMTRLFRTVVTLGVILYGLASFSAHAGSLMGTTTQDVFFPLEKGNKWVFSGPVTWTINGSSQTATMSWPMEVQETWQRDQVFAALLNGHPAETAMYEPTAKQGTFLIVRVGPSWYYLLENADRVSSITRRLSDPEDSLQDLVQDGELWLTNPLQEGSLLGETGQITRADRSYCWQVTSSTNTDLSRFVPSLRGPTRSFVLEYLARNSHQQMEFAPGIGIVRYQSVHHGTPFETDLSLKECLLKSGPESQQPAKSAALLSLEEALGVALDYVKSKKSVPVDQHLGSVTQQYDNTLKKPYWHIQWQWNQPRMGGEYGLAVFMDRSVMERRCGP